jgi:hypothetical protein
MSINRTSSEWPQDGHRTDSTLLRSAINFSSLQISTKLNQQSHNQKLDSTPQLE